MARNPTFNLKTGADSDLIVAREITQSNDPNIGKIKRKDGIYTFPYLTRRTGDTLTGTTENIESNELRHGRTRSAPRKGTSSSSGDINFEFSAETFDDMMEAAFRGKWKAWSSDTASPSNKTGDEYAAGEFATQCGTDGKMQLLGDIGSGALIESANHSKFKIHELNSETDDIKYSLLRKYGGQTGEDLWQEFTHMAVNNMQLSVEINSIITGSFGFMGTNNPKLLNSDEVARDFENRLSTITGSEDLKDKGAWAAATAYAKDDVVTAPSGEYYKCTSAHTSGSSFDATEQANWQKLESYAYFEAIPDHATDTMQFTAREGFLYINGKQIEFAQSLSFNLDNGLTQKFAIFVPNAISTVPLALDVTGDLSTYVVGGESDAKKLFNDAIDNNDIELLFCLQDKLEDPTALYVFQIFKAKHTENTINGNGEDTFDESLPWQSYGEQACRVFRIDIPKPVDAEFDYSGALTSEGILTITPSVAISDMTGVTISVDDIISDGNGHTNKKSYSAGTPTIDGLITLNVTSNTSASVTNVVERTFEIKIDGTTLTKTYKFTETTSPDPVTNASIAAMTTSSGKEKTTINWNDPTDADLDHIEVKVTLADGTVVDQNNVAKGVQSYDTKKLNDGTVYVVNLWAVDVNGNKSTVVDKTFKYAGTPEITLTASQDSGTITAGWTASTGYNVRAVVLDSTGVIQEEITETDNTVDSKDFTSTFGAGTYTVRAYFYKTEGGVDVYGPYTTDSVTVS